jgi:hypothetical protein
VESVLRYATFDTYCDNAEGKRCGTVGQVADCVYQRGGLEARWGGALREIDGRDRTRRSWKPSSPSHTLASVPYAVP